MQTSFMKVKIFVTKLVIWLRKWNRCKILLWMFLFIYLLLIITFSLNGVKPFIRSLEFMHRLSSTIRLVKLLFCNVLLRHLKLIIIKHHLWFLYWYFSMFDLWLLTAATSNYIRKWEKWGWKVSNWTLCNAKYSRAKLL